MRHHVCTGSHGGKGCWPWVRVVPLDGTFYVPEIPGVPEFYRFQAFHIIWKIHLLRKGERTFFI